MNTNINKYIPDGIQSGPDKYGTTFVSSSTYNKQSHSILITGNTWGRFFESHAQYTNEQYDEQGIENKYPIIPSGCFVSVISLPTIDNNANNANNEQSTSSQQYYKQQQQQRQKNNQESYSTTYEISPKIEQQMKFESNLRLHAVSRQQHHHHHHHTMENSKSSNQLDDEEVCTTIHLYYNESEFIIVGHEVKYNYTTIENKPQKVESNGLVFDLSYNTYPRHSFDYHGGKVFNSQSLNSNNNQQQYPVATTNFIQDDNTAYILFAIGSNSNTNNINDLSGIDTYDDDIRHQYHYNPSQYFTYKKNSIGYGIAQYTLLDIEEQYIGVVKKLDQQWFQTYELSLFETKTTTTTNTTNNSANDNSNNPNCIVQDIIALYNDDNQHHQKQGVLLVTGTTNQIGAAFGTSSTITGTSNTVTHTNLKSNDNVNSNNNNDSGNQFGFLTKINPINGQIIDSIQLLNHIKTDAGTTTATTSTTRESNYDISIGGVCYINNDTNSNEASTDNEQNNTPNTNKRFIYVVGTVRTNKSSSSSSSSSSLFAILYRVDIIRMKIIWIERLYADSSSDKKHIVDVVGVGCAVSNDGTNVWVSGTISNNGIMKYSSTQQSYGMTDIFIARYNTLNNHQSSSSQLKLDFIHQFGTNDNDFIATHGGIVIDKYNNAIIIGTTYGSMYRSKSKNEKQNDYSDVFIVSICGKTGTIKVPYNTRQRQHQHTNNNSTTSTTTGDMYLRPRLLNIVHAHNKMTTTTSIQWFIFIINILFIIYGIFHRRHQLTKKRNHLSSIKEY